MSNFRWRFFHVFMKKKEVWIFFFKCCSVRIKKLPQMEVKKAYLFLKMWRVINLSIEIKSSPCSTMHHFLPYFKLAVMILRHSPLLLLTNTTEVEGKIPQLIKVIHPK